MLRIGEGCAYRTKMRREKREKRETKEKEVSEQSLKKCLHN